MINESANGGTEQVYRELHEKVSKNLLEKFQIWFSRYDESKRDDSKIQLLYFLDLPGDPMYDHLKKGDWNRFEKFIFLTNWQMQGFQKWLNFPWSKAEVIQIAFEPIPKEDIDKTLQKEDPVRLIYHTTPHRGLELLINAFEYLAETNHITLDVYSSFSLYGWQERDKPYEELFNRCRNHPNINYHGAVSKDEVRKAVAKAHIFAYPSIWQETGCRTLMEAMSAECLCVHPNYGCLFETAANWTMMYQWQENKLEHTRKFAKILERAFSDIRTGRLKAILQAQKAYADQFYGWGEKTQAWTLFLRNILLKKGIKTD